MTASGGPSDNLFVQAVTARLVAVLALLGAATACPEGAAPDTSDEPVALGDDVPLLPVVRTPAPPDYVPRREVWSCDEPTRGCENGRTITGDVDVMSAADLAAIADVSCITGDLTIETPDLHTLDGLQNLRRVDGTLRIVRNDELVTTAGLGRLDFAGALDITSNPALERIDTSVLAVETLFLVGNDVLSDLSGLQGLSSITGHIYVGYNDALGDLEGLGCVTNVFTDVTISNNAGLQSLAGLEGLNEVGQQLILLANPALASVEALAGLEVVHDALTLEDLPALKSLDGLDNLEEVGATLRIVHNEGLESVEALDGLTAVGGGLSIDRNFVLRSLVGLEGLTQVPGRLQVHKNHELVDLVGLENLVTVGGDAHISENWGLAEVAGLGALTSVGGSLYVSANPALVHLDGLSALATVGGEMHISYNEALERVVLPELSGSLDNFGMSLNLSLVEVSLPGVVEIDGRVRILENAIATLSLASLTRVGNELRVQGNAELTGFSMPELADIGGDLSVFENYALAQMGLSSLARVGAYVSIFDNFVLGDTVAWDLISQLESAGGYGELCVETEGIRCQPFVENNGI